MNSSHQKLALFADTLTLSYEKFGEGRPYLVLHGGAGPQSINGLAAALGSGGHVIVPIHPGFNGTPRPEWCKRISDLASVYLALLEALDVHDVVVVGNSVGGWIAAEMALRHASRIAGIVLLNAAGIDTGSPTSQIADPMQMAPAERAAAAFYDPARYGIMPTTPDAVAAMIANQQTLRVYAGDPFMHDPSLHGRLSALRVPTLVLWGESDRIVDLAYGQRFAAAIPGASFVGVPEAGHFPQIEQLDIVLAAIREWRV
ncbi:MAG: alpha/beta hydrolase [Burkholderiales bacterium]|nr:alpha/beta hydrolase [Burkholderiales bacterium]